MQNGLYKYLVLLLHSHRHNIAERLNDFEDDDIQSDFSCSFQEEDVSIIREVLYKYSKSSL